MCPGRAACVHVCMYAYAYKYVDPHKYIRIHVAHGKVMKKHFKKSCTFYVTIEDRKGAACACGGRLPHDEWHLGLHCRAPHFRHHAARGGRGPGGHPGGGVAGRHHFAGPPQGLGHQVLPLPTPNLTGGLCFIPVVAVSFVLVDADAQRP